MVRRRHRRGHYALRETPSVLGFFQPFIGAAIVLLIIFFIGSRILSFFGIGDQGATGATLTVEGRGTVNVSIEGSELRRAESNLKVYPNDRVQTESSAFAVLKFFDGTSVRLDENSEIEIAASNSTEKKGAVEVKLLEGSLWIAIPEEDSVPVSRIVLTSGLNATLPQGTEAVISVESISVFAANGLGIDLLYRGGEDPIIIGEGQQFTLPDTGTIAGDPYTYRNPLDPTLLVSSFVEQSRSKVPNSPGSDGDSSTDTLPDEDEVILTVLSPSQGLETNKSTVSVRGEVGSSVASVRANGYTIAITEGERTFQQELALSDDETVTVHIEALDTEGTVLAEVRRTVHRDRTPPDAPKITSPARSGSTYKTTNTSLEIEGTVGPGINAIEVNDYRLQLFDPGDRKWSYLASTTLSNLSYGENVFEITAINEGGLKSTSTITIVLSDEGEEGIIEDTESAEDAEDADDSLPVIDGPLPENDPIAPGSLSVSLPSEGTSHTASGTGELLIEGKASPAVFTVWVNDYRLRLFEPGKTFWNYRASTELGTMKRGTNEYEIVTRNRDGKILDKMIYTIELE